ncbi:MAG: helix-turn-helix domain-containing protein, partial [Chloroflexota bacterium]
MGAVRFGLAVRALRRHHGWSQEQVAEKAGISQAAVSRAERGEAWSLTHRALVEIVEALGARATLRVQWHGEELDRLLDAAHAGLVEEVIRILVTHGPEVAPEVTLARYGERGSIDVLAFHAATGSLLVIEVKSVVPDMQGCSPGSIGSGVSPAAWQSRAGGGWRVRSVSRLLVLPDDRTARRRLVVHALTINQTMPLRTAAVRRWLPAPGGAMGGVLVLPSRQRTTARHRVRRSGDPKQPESGVIAAGQAPAGGSAGYLRTSTRPLTWWQQPAAGRWRWD